MFPVQPIFFRICLGFFQQTSLEATTPRSTALLRAQQKAHANTRQIWRLSSSRLQQYDQRSKHSTAHNSPSCETAAGERCRDDPDQPDSMSLGTMDATNALCMLSHSMSDQPKRVIQDNTIIALLQMRSAEHFILAATCHTYITICLYLFQISFLIINIFSLTSRLPFVLFGTMTFPGACGRCRRHHESLARWNLSKTSRHSSTLLVHGLHKFSQRSAIASSRQALS